jgi:hypothetical protein
LNKKTIYQHLTRRNLFVLVIGTIIVASIILLRPNKIPDATYQQAVVQTENAQKYWSPNNRYYFSVTLSGSWLVDTADLRAVSPYVYLHSLPQFDAWSSDSRYLILSTQNQYRFESTNIFDTQKWKNVSFSHPCSGLEGSSCSERFRSFTSDNKGFSLGTKTIQFDELEASGRFICEDANTCINSPD